MVSPRQQHSPDDEEWFDNIHRHSPDLAEYDVNKVEYVKRKVMRNRYGDLLPFKEEMTKNGGDLGLENEGPPLGQ